MALQRELILRLDRSRELLLSDVAQPVTLARAADEAFLSAFHFQRLFKRTYGESPLVLLTRYRIDRAKELLLKSDLSVTEICFEIGYSSLGTFSTRFRDITGRSPTEFREVSRRFFDIGKLWSHKLVPHCFVVHPRS